MGRDAGGVASFAPRLLVLVLALALATPLAGCSSINARMGDGLPAEKLAADNKGIVLMHTSLHEQRCDTISAVLTQQDASGRWVRGENVILKGMLDLRKLPAQIVVPAGEYGFGELACTAYKRVHTYHARIAERGSIWDGSGRVYAKPFATFKVSPGEVVDIGSLRLPVGRSGFVAVVTPIPEAWLATLAAENPSLYQARTVRLMSAAIRLSAI